MATTIFGVTVMNRFLLPCLVLVATVILLGLGTWQMKRLAWKEAIIAKREAGLAMSPVDLRGRIDDWQVLDFRPVTLKGHFRHDLEQIYGVRARAGVFGHHVLTPLTLDDDTTLLVNRGWVPADKVDPETRMDAQPRGSVSVAGIARYRLNDQPGWFTPDNDPAGKRWYHYDLAVMENALGIDLAPLVVAATDRPDPTALPIAGLTESKLANNHLQYAVTWYGLAVGLIGVYMVFRRQQAKSSETA